MKENYRHLRGCRKSLAATLLMSRRHAFSSSAFLASGRQEASGVSFKAGASGAVSGAGGGSSSELTDDSERVFCRLAAGSSSDLSKKKASD